MPNKETKEEVVELHCPRCGSVVEPKKTKAGITQHRCPNCNLLIRPVEFGGKVAGGKAVEKTKEAEDGEKEERVISPEITGGIFRYTITLPADAFTLFNVARGFGLEKDGKLFDEWIFDCITKRFEKDYKMQLILAPLEEEAQ